MKLDKWGLLIPIIVTSLCFTTVRVNAQNTCFQNVTECIAQRLQCSHADHLNPNDQSGDNRQNAQTKIIACDKWLGTVTALVTHIDTEKLGSLEVLIDSFGYRDPDNRTVGRGAIFQALVLEATNTLYFEAEAERVISLDEARGLLTKAKKMAAFAINGKVKAYRAMASSASAQIQQDLNTWR